jgi:uncharacterized repeat protein (TIGR01451 family)
MIRQALFGERGARGVWLLLVLLGVCARAIAADAELPGASTPVHSAAPVAPHASMPSSVGVDATASGFATVAIRCPDAIQVNEPFVCELQVTALDHVRNVVVDQPIPAGLEVVGSSPVAVLHGAFLEWRLATLARGEQKRILVKYLAKTGQPVTLCANIAAEAYVCATTRITQPRISIQKTGPATALLGSTVTYTILVRNTGDGIARNVVVRDTLPAELRHADGAPELTFQLGEFGPGEEKSIAVPLQAVAAGRPCNRAQVETSNAGTADASACTDILRQGLAITKTGPRLQFFNKPARYTIVVENTGDTTLRDVLVVDRVPAATRFVSAPGATRDGDLVNWTIPTLAPRARQSFTITLTSATAGTHRNTVEAATREGLRRSAAAETLWKGQAALLIEVVDIEDPLTINEKETYTISVKNQGTEADHNITLDATLSANVVPVAASGVTHGSVAGQTVTFVPYASLGPQQVITYTIKAKAISTGDARIKVHMSSALLANPVTEEESTQVY